MEKFDGNPGTSRLASVLTQRMKRENESPLLLDFGEIQGNGSLMTNTFPIPIPKGEYSICGQLPIGKAGDRVLVAWVQSEAVVVNLVEKS